MSLAAQLPLYLTILVLTNIAVAGLPWDSQISHPVLKTADIVTFDPLSFLAILWNPRASTSAARLYMQSGKKTFRWPHMMQIGAVTVPVYVLVNYLTSNYRSKHPGSDMCQENIDMLDVKVEGSSFSKLPISPGDSSLINALNFKHSMFPTNDMMVVYLTGMGKEDILLSSKKAWIVRKLVLCTEIVMGLIVVCGTVFSALLGDIWAIVLFATYLFHWLASTAISFRQLVIPAELSIQDDKTIVFAVYNRPSGGLIIFKCTQDILEKWARTKWVFSPKRSDTQSRFDTFAHWIWIATGTAAAFASQACMVNMSGYLQLGFLGMLFYSSVAELWLTVLANELPTDTFRRSLSTKMAGLNDKRYKSIIQASLGFDQDQRLHKLRWIDLGLLPKMAVFSAMVITLDYLNNLDTPNGPVVPRNLADAKDIFLKQCGTIPDKDIPTRKGIWDEIENVWLQRQKKEAQMLQVHHV
jgi:hypothetical protein